MNQKYKVIVCDRKYSTARISSEDIHAYLKNKGWNGSSEDPDDPGIHYDDSIFWTNPDKILLVTSLLTDNLSDSIEAIAIVEKRFPSEVLSDIVGYPVGIEKNRLSVLRNSASAHVVEAREALERAEVALKAKPKNANLISAVETANKNLKKTEEEFNKLTKALETVE